MRDFARYTVQRRGPRRRFGWRALLAPVVLALVVCAAGTAFAATSSGGGFGFPGGEVAAKSAGPGAAVETNNLSDRREVSKDPINVLALGVDERSGAESEGAGVRADTIMLVRIFPESGEVRLLSIPRDLFVEVAPGERDRVNAAYAYGGVDQTVSAVERYTGIGVDHSATVNFQGFQAAVDALGGVEVDVKGDYPADLGVSGSGRQTLDGEQALLWARYRDTPNGDLDRIGHQQQLVSALREKSREPGTLARLPRLIGVFEQNVRTDLDAGETLSLARTLLSAGSRSGEESAVKTYELRGTPETLDDGREVLIPEDQENRSIISRFLAN